MEIRNVVRIMGVVSAAAVSVIVSVGTVVFAAQIHQDAGSQPNVRPRLMIATILESANPTDAQRAQIQTIMETHRPDILAARQAQDIVALRKAVRQVMGEIVQTLTPEQREVAKNAVRQVLAARP